MKGSFKEIGLYIIAVDEFLVLLLQSNVLGHLREKFQEKLSIYESSNRSLRHLLRDQQESEAAVLRLSEHRDLLQEKLGHAENMLMVRRMSSLWDFFSFQGCGSSFLLQVLKKCALWWILSNTVTDHAVGG